MCSGTTTAVAGAMLPRTGSSLLVLFTLGACGPPLPPWPPDGSRNTPDVHTSDGRVLGVERRSAEDPASFVYLTVQAGEQPIRVELGPGWYLDEHGLTFATEQRVTVQGRRVTRSGQPILVARRIQKGSQVLILRDEHDRPLWQR